MVAFGLAWLAVCQVVCRAKHAAVASKPEQLIEAGPLSWRIAGPCLALALC